LTGLRNLVVDLTSIQTGAETAPPGVEISAPHDCDERTLAWIDETFGGVWSSEVHAGDTIVARRDSEPVGFATIGARGLRYAWLRGLAEEPNVGLFGPFGVAPNERGAGIGRSLLRRALGALRERGYARALIAAVTDDGLERYYRDAAGAHVAERFDRDALLRPHRRTLVMASGNGGNFQAVVDAQKNGSLPLEIIGLLSNNPRAYAIERAQLAGVPARVVAWKRKEESRVEYDARLLNAAKSQKPDLVLMLGWMHLLPEWFVAAFPALLNLHPAFLPLDPRRDDVVMPDGARIRAFRGPRAVHDALALGSAWVGATLHRVTADTDRGPVMARKPLQVRAGENEGDLMERVHEIERSVVRAGITRWLFET
jgi:phosphoribosylglycinamide formyltransferase 1